MIRFQTAWVVAALALGASMPAAHAQTGGKTVQQLEQEIAARDAVISDLQRRVQALEEKTGGTPGRPAAPPPAAAKAPVKSAPPPATAQAPKSPAPPRAKPKAEEPIDEELLSRALERSLVLRGGLLLNRGEFEIEPGLSYNYTNRPSIGLVRRENYTASLGFRAGLPWAAQFEFTVPYAYQKVETGIPSLDHKTGIGDISIGLSKQLLTEGSGGWPGLLANISYTRATGDSSLGLPLFVAGVGAGFHSWQATLTAIKRMDPLVFVGSLSHSFNRSATVFGTSIDPNDTTSGSFRAILATSPSVSLRGGFSLAHTGNTKVNGVVVPGTNQNVALLEFGGSVTLTRRILLDFSMGAGLTDAAPDYVLGVSLPIRF